MVVPPNHRSQHFGIEPHGFDMGISPILSNPDPW